MFSELWKSFKNLYKKGLFHIFGSSVIAQIGGLISSVVVVRKLPKSSYGYYVSANNFYQYASVFIGLGLIVAVLQYCSEKSDEDKKNSIYKYTFYKGTIFNFLILFVLFVFGFIYRFWGSETTGLYIMYMSGLPFVVYFNTHFQTVLRVKRLNSEYAYTNICYTVVSLVSNIYFTYILGTVGLIISLYLSNIFATLFAYYFLKKRDFFNQISNNDRVLEKNDRRKLISYSLFCSVTNFSSSMLMLLDVTCLNIVLKDSEILADYKVASIIPTACLFVPSCLITFFYPMMVEKFGSDIISFRKYILKLLVFFLCVNSVVFVLIEIFSPYVISIVYGEKYLNVSYLFRILGVNFLLSSIKKLFGNTIAVMKKLKVNLIVTSISGALNIVLNFFLIQKYGSVGAAVATVIVTSFTIILLIIYLFKYFKKPMPFKQI